MQYSKVPLIAGVLAGALLMGGCATYRSPRPLYSYYAVPCDTPGAVQAIPIGAGDVPPASRTADPQPVSSTPTSSEPAPTEQGPKRAARTPGGSPRCVIAVADRGRYGGGYGGYRPGYSGFPYYGGIGLGLGFGVGSHLGGGHHSSFSGVHGGGHRGRGHR